MVRGPSITLTGCHMRKKSKHWGLSSHKHNFQDVCIWKCHLQVTLLNLNAVATSQLQETPILGVLSKGRAVVPKPWYSGVEAAEPTFNPRWGLSPLHVYRVVRCSKGSLHVPLESSLFKDLQGGGQLLRPFLQNRSKQPPQENKQAKGAASGTTAGPCGAVTCSAGTSSGLSLEMKSSPCSSAWLVLKTTSLCIGSF